MIEQRFVKIRFFAILVGSVGALAFMAAGAAAQSPDYSPVTSFDAYGNARHRWVDRNSFGTSPIYRPATTSPINTLLQTRRSAARQGFGFNEAAATYGLSGRPIKTARSGWQDGRGGLPRSFQLYGGFGERSETGGNIGSALARKRALIQATSLVAPVHRAMIRNSSFGDPLQMAVEHPFLDQPTEPIEGAKHVPLEELLTKDADSVFERSMDEGWGAFAEGQYRLAARSFEAAATIKPDKVEPSIGQVFCYAAVGAMKTATAVLPQIAASRGNFFSIAGEMDMGSRFARAAEVADVSIQTRLHAAENPADVNAAALNVIVQWFLGRKGEAQAAASAMSRTFPTSTFANWPSLLNDELTSTTSVPNTGS